MGETPEGPMPGREEPEDKLETVRVFKYRKYPDYDAAVELVKMLRGLGVYMHIKCPKCGSEGSISVIKHPNGYSYVVIRHPDRSTHMVPRNQISEVFRELCEVKKDLEYILKQYRKFEESGVKFCIEGE
jgi:rRNA maturation protein Nop10